MNTSRIITALIAMAMLTACNTMEGLGNDVQQAGSAISRSANTSK